MSNISQSNISQSDISQSNVSQSDSGKAWEYGLARAFADQLPQSTPLAKNWPHTRSQDAYYLLSAREKARINRAASESVDFLYAHDGRLEHTDYVMMQSDQEGRYGDVRDVLVYTAKGIVGISAKHRHKALKHSRLSRTIDFGKDWYDTPCSQEYWQKVDPVFEELRRHHNKQMRWRNLNLSRSEKWGKYYVPVLEAFITETVKYAKPDPLVRYLLGRYDFYKVMKENGSILLQSFNIRGTLKWGKKVRLPNRIIRFEMKPRSKTTAIMYLDEGWQLSFRIHSASSKVEPSLKFDVQLIGVPSSLSSHEIPYET